VVDHQFERDALVLKEDVLRAVGMRGGDWSRRGRLDRLPTGPTWWDVTVHNDGGLLMADTLTLSEARALAGSVDDLTLAEILKTGATAAELAEARLWLENDEVPLNEGRSPTSSRVKQVIALLKAMEEDTRPSPEW
jgi:hypothetical protein